MSVWHTKLNLNPILDHDVEFYHPKKQIFPPQDPSPKQSTKLHVMSDRRIFSLRLDTKKESDTTPVPFN